jgi:hypothetical protein
VDGPSESCTVTALALVFPPAAFRFASVSGTALSLMGICSLGTEFVVVWMGFVPTSWVGTVGSCLLEGERRGGMMACGLCCYPALH